MAQQLLARSPARSQSSKSMPERTLSSSSSSTLDPLSDIASKRTRVCKACNRCRLKKSKCDGSYPCTRCQSDNAICGYGAQKKPAHDRPHPKGYVEMLEQQRAQLVSGLREMYRRLQQVDAWRGPDLTKSDGHPLTHDILAALNLLDAPEELEDPSDAEIRQLANKLFDTDSSVLSDRFALASESVRSDSPHSPDTPTFPGPSTGGGESNPDHNNNNNNNSTNPFQFDIQMGGYLSQELPPDLTFMETPTFFPEQMTPFDPVFYHPEWANYNEVDVKPQAQPMQDPPPPATFGQIPYGALLFNQQAINTLLASSMQGVSEHGLCLDPKDIEGSKYVSVGM